MKTLSEHNAPFGPLPAESGQLPLLTYITRPAGVKCDRCGSELHYQWHQWRPRDNPNHPRSVFCPEWECSFKGQKFAE